MPVMRVSRKDSKYMHFRVRQGSKHFSDFAHASHSLPSAHSQAARIPCPVWEKRDSEMLVKFRDFMRNDATFKATFVMRPRTLDSAITIMAWQVWGKATELQCTEGQLRFVMTKCVSSLNERSISLNFSSHPSETRSVEKICQMLRCKSTKLSFL